ncbi:MAG: pentapeptide repeat-containing protein [Chloroflexota bacterium]
MRAKIRNRIREFIKRLVRDAYEHRYTTAFILALLPLALLMIYWAIWSRSSPARVGFAPITVWDWLNLLIFPIIFGTAAYWFIKIQRDVRVRIAESQEKTEQSIADNNRNQATLEAYYEYLTNLLVERGLRNADEDNEIRRVARTRTLAVLRGLDGERKGQVLQFLHESNLISKPTVIDLTGANLNQAYLPDARLLDADLRDANLAGAVLDRANLRGAYLREANLHEASLREAYFRESNLRGADLRDANLREANFRDAYLRGANLRAANLRDANLRDTNLRDANLRDAKLRGAYLRGTNLIGADLAWADLRGANLSGAVLTGANLSGANLSGATLNEANLSEANLGQANLHEADVVLANLSKANLREANLVWAYLVWSDLTGARLTGADLTEATLRGADLTGADLSDATILDEQLSIVKSLEGTTLANGQRAERNQIKLEQPQQPPQAAVNGRRRSSRSETAVSETTEPEAEKEAER